MMKNLTFKYRNLLLISFFSILSLSETYSQRIDVAASAGTATGSYFNLSDAFAKINDGTHKGVITLTVKQNYFEFATNPTLLNASGVGFASYTSIKIVPSGNRTITGQPPNGRGIINLNGADNVTIDGDDPNTAGTKNLSFELSPSNPTQTSCIRIRSASNTDPATNITVRNCKFDGSRNGISSSTENFGVVCSDNTTTSAMNGAHGLNNISIDSNEFVECHIAIGVYGDNTDKNTNVTIRNNTIGQSSIQSKMIGRYGIDIRNCGTGASTKCIIEDNNISVGFNNTSGVSLDDVAGINISRGCTNILVNKNDIHDIYNNTTSAARWIEGIAIFGNNNDNATITNNFVRNVVGRKKTTTPLNASNYGISAFGTSTGVKISNNTIALISPNTYGTTANYFCTSMAIGQNVDVDEVANNIIVNLNNSSNAYGLYMEDYSQSTTTSSLVDKNCFYVPNGSIGNSATPKDLTNWQLTSGLDGQSFSENPPFVSTTDLHIQDGKATQLESNGLSLAIAEDIDEDQRPGPFGSVHGGASALDIGADEFDGIIITLPKIIIVTHTPTTQSCFAGAKTITANIDKGNAIDSVILEYQYNNGVKNVKTIDTLANGLYSGTIPAAFPGDAIVKYRVYCLLSTGDTVASNYGYYNDFTASKALVPNFTSDPTQACVGSTVDLKYDFGEDPTGVSLPPKVSDSLGYFDITTVSVGTLNNTSNVNSLTGTIGTASGILGGYSDFTAIQTDSFDIGKGYPITIHAKSPVESKCYFSVYIDLNGDGDFEDLYENPLNTHNVNNTDTFFIEKGNIYFPPNTRPGITKMRIVASPSRMNTPYDNLGFGEIEDYNIYVNPLTYTWKVNNVLSNTNNPNSISLTSIPTTYKLEITDANSCKDSSTSKSITLAPSAFTAKLNGITNQCFNTTQFLSVDITGGCPPFSYVWNKDTSLKGSTFPINMQKDTLRVHVKVTSNNGFVSIDSMTIFPNNPQLDSLALDELICNRGSGVLTSISETNDTAFWYNSFTDAPFEHIFMGDTFMTPILDATKTYYAAAFSSDKQTVGKPDLGGTDNLSNQTMRGITFTATEPITITKCNIYGSGSGAQIKVAVLDKFGTLVSVTPTIHVNFGANSTTAIEIPLNLLVPNAGSGYRLVLFEELNVTGMRYSTSGFTYPTSNTTSMPITSGYNQSDMASNNGTYSYFYDIEIVKNLCVGEKKAIDAIVTPARVPAISKNLNYTQLCKGDTIKLDVESDSIADYYFWYKDGSQMINQINGRYTDTFYVDSLIIPLSSELDSGEYQVEIRSLQFCTRDTFSRIVRVDYWPEVDIKKDLETLNVCITSDGELEIDADFSHTYQWYKDGAAIAGETTKKLVLPDVDYPDDGKYKVTMNDIHNCREVSSKEIFVVVHDTPTYVSTGPNDTICEGEIIKIFDKIDNATDYVWYKDGGILPFNIVDSMIVWSATVKDSGSYQLKGYSYPGCPDAWSEITHITVNPKPKQIGYLKDIKLCEGDKFKVVANAENYTNIEWYKGATLLSTNDSIVVDPVSTATTGSYSYKVKALDKCSDVNSNSFNLNVVSQATITGTLPATLMGCEGDDLTQSVSHIGGTIFKWYKDGHEIQFQTGDELNINSLTKNDEGKYTVTVNSDEVCPEVESSELTLTVMPTAKLTSDLIGTSGYLCDGSNINLSITADNANTYTWFRDGNQLPSTNGNSLSISNAQVSNSGKYSVRVSGSAPCDNPVNSEEVEITVLSSMNNVSLTKVSEYKAEEQCTDGLGWTYFAPQNEPERLIFAVKKNGNSFKASADIIVRPTVYRNISNSSQDYDATFMMQRMWNLNVDTGSINSPIQVKFYYDENERDALLQKAIDLEEATNGEVARINNDIKWFKTDTLPFSSNLLNVVSGKNFNFSNVEVLPSIEGTDNGVQYMIFEEINEAGGGTGYIKMEGDARFITSIHDIEANISPVIIPNPNNGSFRLDVLTQQYGDMEIEIFNSIGQRVYTEAIKNASNKFEHNINLNNISNGIYYLRLTQDESVSNLRFEVSK